MGIVISTVVDNICTKCDGTGKYPSYITCYSCHGTGYYYSVQGSFIDIFERIKYVTYLWKSDYRGIQINCNSSKRI